MIYNFGMKNNEITIMNIDSQNFLRELECYFAILDFEELSLKVKQMVKQPDQFYKLCDDFEIKDKEMFLLLQYTFVDVFNKRMLTSLHKIYNLKGNVRNESKTRSQKLR